MSKISTYEVAPVPKLSDKLIGTSVGGEIEDITYNFTLLELLELFLPVIPANNLQGVLDYGNTATQDINLFGTITTTNLEVTDTANLFITYLNEETHIVGSLFDSADSIGTAGQVLTSTGDGVEWFTLPPIFTPNLQQVLEEGNTADLDIILDADLEAINITADTANIATQLSIQGVVVDYNESAGTAGQVLESTVTGVQWTNLPVYSATSPLLFNSGTNTFSIQVANSTQGGYLTANDWVTFDGKQNAGAYITALTGEATATGPGSVPITLNNASVIAKVLTGLNITGGSISATDSILTAFGKVQNQINGLMGGVQYQGVWDAATNTPTLTSSVGTQGHYYIVNVAGTTNLNGITDWQVGDWAIFSGGAWQKVDNTDSVTSVNGQTGAVSLTTDNIPEGTTNLYFLDSRARAAVSATSPLSYNNTTGVFSIQQASGTQNGYLSSTDWTTFNNKQNYLGGTGLVKSTAGTITYITDNSSNWNTAYNRSIISAAVTGTGTKTLTLNEQDGNTITASWSDADTGLTSVGLTMPSAFSVANSPLTSNGTIGVTGAGTTAQYIRGDGSLATFPSIISEAQNLVTEVYNSSGATLTKGTVVYINGGQGNLPTITKAIATGDPTSAQTYGVVRSDITNMNNGYVVVTGRLGDLDTRDYTPGQQLYLSSTTAGAWTPTKQYAPAHLVYVGIVVRAHPTQGVVEVLIQNGFEMDELHNVAAQNPDNNDILQFKTSTNLWTKVAGTTTNIAEGTNLYYLDSRARAALSFTPGSGAYNSTTGVITIPTNTNQLTNGAAFITLGSLSALAPLSYNNTTGVFSISQSGASTDGYLSSTDWNTFNNKQPAGSYVPTSRQLTINGTQYDLSADRSWSVGTVTSVAALTLGTSGTDLSSSVANGTTTPVITLNVPTASAANRGALSAADWSTFNTKVGGVTASSPLASSGGQTPNITIQQASGSQDGYLSSTDWTTFNNKQAAGNYITSLTGEATASGPGAASVTLNNASVTAKVLTGVNITGGSISATDSILTAFGKVQNQINGLVGGSIYQGTWNAATNTPALASGVGTKGYYYIVSVAGTTNLDGITDWFVGDWAIFDGTAWQQVDNTDAVVSVNGQTGAVSLTTDNIPEGSTNQYFLNSRARAALSFTAGSGAYNSTTGVITIPTNTSQLTNGANFITLASLSGTAPIVYSNTTGAISITQAGTASNGYLSSTDWNTFNNKQATISLTTTGTSGAATLVGTTLNIPQYQGALTNPVTGTGLLNRVTKFNSNGSTVTYGLIYDDGSSIETNAFTYITKTLIPRQAVSYETNFKSLIGSTPGWIYLGNLVIPQQGYNACITMDAGAGYNAALSQMGYLKLHIRTSNTTPSGGFYFTAFAEQFGYSNFIQEIRITENISTSTYGIYVYSNTFIGTGYYKVEGSVIQYTPVETATAPPATYYQVPLAFTVNSSTTINNTLTANSNLYVAGITTLNTTVGDYAATITNVHDSSQGLAIRATDNDTNLYLLSLQSSNTTTGQTWIDRFTVAKNGVAAVSYTGAALYGLTVSNVSDNLRFRLGTTTGGYLNIQGQKISDGTSYAISLQADGANVLIGTTTDAGYKFDVSGTGRFTGQLTSGTQFYVVASPPATNGGLINVRDTVTATNVTSFAGVFFNSSPGNDYSIGKLTENNVGFLQIRNANSGAELLRINASGITTLSNLAGTGTRIVVADANGTLSASSALSGYITGSGTANYVPKFTSASAIGNSALQEVSGNLGLGVTPPSWTYFKSINIGGSSVAAAGSSSIVLSRNWYYDGGEKYYENGQAQRLELVLNGFYFNTAANNTSGAGATLTWSTPMQLLPTGNLLLNKTTDSGERLQVNGTGRFNDSVTVQNYLYVQPDAATGLQGLYIQNNNTGGYGATLGLGLYGYATGAYFNTLRIESSYPGFGRTLFYTKAQSNSSEVLALNLDGTGTASFSAVVTAGGASNIDNALALQISSGGVGTQKWIGVNKNNSYGLLIGYNEISAGLAGTGAYIRQVTTDPLYFLVNNTTLALTLASTGAATFSSSVTAGGSGNVILGVDGTYANYNTIGFGGTLANGQNRIFAGNSSNGDGIYLQSKQGITFWVSGTSTAAYIASNGNIIINNSTTDAGYKFDVNGTGRFTGQVTAATYLTLSEDGTYTGTYYTLGFSGKSNGANRIFAARDGSDGMYFAAATSRGFEFRPNGSTVGTFFISPTGIVTIAGPTSTPAALIVATGNSNCDITLQSANSSSVSRIRNGTNDLQFHTNGSQQMTITSGGNVGIGLSTGIDSKLTISSSTKGLGVNESNVQIQSNESLAANIGGSLGFGATSDYGIVTLAKVGGYRENATGTSVSSYLAFETRSGGNAVTERMRISSVGQLIFKGSATNSLASAYIENTNSSFAIYTTEGGGTTKDLILQCGGSASANNMILKANGNLLLGTPTDSGYKLDVTGTLRAVGTIRSNEGYVYSNGIINVTGGSASWIFLGTISIGQGGHTAVITIEGGSGYNADEGQNGSARIFIRTSNGSPNGSGWYYSATLTQMGYNSNVVSSCIITQTNATTYNVYVNFGAYSGNTYYKVEGSTFSWTASNSNYGATAPTGGQTITNVFKVISTATFQNSVTASAFYESSDSRLKQLIKDDYRALGIEAIKPKLYIKDGREEVGYFAQDVKDILSTAVSVNDAGFLSLSYTQVHTAKIAIIEDEVDLLKKEVAELKVKLQKYEA